MRIIFFIESLRFGGKERRLLELIRYLKIYADSEIALVITEEEIHYSYVHELDVNLKVIQRKWLKKDPLLFIKFYRYCLSFNPDLIHCWGFMNTFYAIPSKVILRIPLVSSMITTSKKPFKLISFKSLFFNISCRFSDIILSNSKAGLRAFKINSPKAKVIYNGVQLERFEKKINTKEVRKELGIKNKFIVIMVATFSKLKDYDFFLEVAKRMKLIRDDVTFLAVGDGGEWIRIQQRILDEEIDNVCLTGRRLDVEALITASDIGVLFTNIDLHGEGISNSIIEYMALGKPVITTDIFGGSSEIISEGETGYCMDRDPEKITAKINSLLNNESLRISMGQKGKEHIKSNFSIDKMGKQHEIVYRELLEK